jgi:ketosteroid isomerase-like protein
VSQENVQRLREGYASFGRGDERLFEDLMHPDFRYRSREELPGGGEFEGREVFFRRLAELRELFAEIHFEPADFIVSGEYVVATLSWSALGRGGGVRVAQDLVHVWRMRDGKGVELQVFSDKAEALEAVVAGLSE